MASSPDTMAFIVCNGRYSVLGTWWILRPGMFEVRLLRKFSSLWMIVTPEFREVAFQFKNLLYQMFRLVWNIGASKRGSPKPRGVKLRQLQKTRGNNTSMNTMRTRNVSSNNNMQYSVCIFLEILSLSSIVLLLIWNTIPNTYLSSTAKRLVWRVVFLCQRSALVLDSFAIVSWCDRQCIQPW